MQRKGGDSISARRITQTKRIDRSSDRGTGIGCSRGQGEGKIRRNNWKAMRSTDSLPRGEEGIDPRPSVDEISPPRQHENDVGDAARGGEEGEDSRWETWYRGRTRLDLAMRGRIWIPGNWLSGSGRLVVPGHDWVGVEPSTSPS